MAFLGFFWKGHYCSECVRLCLWDWIGRLTLHLRGHVFKGSVWEDNGEITRCGVFYGSRFFFFFPSSVSLKNSFFQALIMTRWLVRSCGHKTDLIQLKFLKKCCTSLRCSFILKGISGPWTRTDLWALQVGTLASPAVFWRWNRPSEEWRERSNARAGHGVTWASMRLETHHQKKKKGKMREI